ncbi:hypothetical protein [Bacillus altitudinis]|nr:hypothetical protein [Bacillus altitudinis]
MIVGKVWEGYGGGMGLWRGFVGGGVGGIGVVVGGMMNSVILLFGWVLI